MNLLFIQRARRCVFAIGALAAICVLSGGGYLGALQLTGNFHAVIANELYRSGQPSAEQIAEYNRHYGIKTIVNLRGPNPHSAWYKSELAETQQLGMTHIDFSMSAKHKLTRTQAAQLIDILKRAEKPILIHCNAGADRSGLAAALYLAAVANVGVAEAERQISIRYGHISSPLSASYAMDQSFEALEPWLASQGR